MLGLADRHDPQARAVPDPRGQLDGARLVGGDHQGAARPDLADEGLEGLVDLFQRGVVGVVVQLHVEDDGDLGGVRVEAAVALVGLRDEDLAAAVLGVGPRRVQVAADRVRRVEAERGQRDREHRGGGGLAVRARDRDRPGVRHQRGQRVAAVHHRQPALAGRGQLRVLRADRAGHDHGGRVRRQVRRVVADVHGRAQRAQRRRRLGVLRVAARHPRPALGQDLGDPRHPGAADADEVRPVAGRGARTGWTGSCAGLQGVVASSGLRPILAPRRPWRAPGAALPRLAAAPGAGRSCRPRAGRRASAPARRPCAAPGTSSRGGRTPPRSAAR